MSRCLLISELHERHGRELSGFAMKITGRRDEAAELLQDVYTDLCARAETGKPLPAQLDGLRRYAYRAIINRHIDKTRKAARRRKIMERLPPPPSVTPDPVHQVDDRDVVRRALAALSPQQRTAIVLHKGYDLRLADVADLMDVSVPTVQSWIQRGLARLTRALPSDEDSTVLT